MMDANAEADLKRDFWNALEGDQTIMLGLLNDGEGIMRPMTAQIDRSAAAKERGDGEICFFASRGEGIGADLSHAGNKAFGAFQAKGHDILASIRGTLAVVEDRATIERLWSPYAELYYKDGKDDPNLLLLRLESATADVWRAETNGFFKSIAFKVLGKDPGQASPEDRGELAL